MPRRHGHAALGVGGHHLHAPIVLGRVLGVEGHGFALPVVPDGPPLHSPQAHVDAPISERVHEAGQEVFGTSVLVDPPIARAADQPCWRSVIDRPGVAQGTLGPDLPDDCPTDTP